jgi:hypothetical protein
MAVISGIFMGGIFGTIAGTAADQIGLHQPLPMLLALCGGILAVFVNRWMWRL